MLPQPSLPNWMDRYKASRVAQMRALGFGQEEIAQQVGLSQQSVSRYLQGINESARQSDNADAFLLALILIAAGAAFIALLASAK